MKLEVVLRPMTDADRAFVLMTWLDSYAQANLTIRTCPHCHTGLHHIARRLFPYGVFHRLYAPIVNGAFARSTVTIAGSPEIKDSILGWMATEGETLHYLFTKPRWRKLGIAKKLLAGTESLALAYSHEPPWWAKLPQSWRYDPQARFGDEP